MLLFYIYNYKFNFKKYNIKIIEKKYNKLF